MRLSPREALTEIPADVRRLVYGSLATVPHLEVLLLLRQLAPDAVTAEELAKRVGLKPAALERTMFELMAHGLLVAAHGMPIAYRYGPRTPELAGSVGRLAELYDKARLKVTGLILDREHESLRLFADAFRLRSED
jgi:DNA-binding IclR family transcriptional regulator